MPNIIPFLTYLVVTTFTPGPNNIVSMSNGMRSGYKKTLPFLVGIFTGFLIMMLICAWLNFFLISWIPQLKTWLNILGAIYMVYLAVHIFMSKPDNQEGNGKGLNTFLAGLGMQFLNPKVILYGVTIFSIFILPDFPNPEAFSLFAPLLAGVAFIATSCWALGGNILSIWIHGHFRIFNSVMSGLLIYTAAASLFH